MPPMMPPEPEEMITIPKFNAEDYLSFRDDILAASVPDECGSDEIALENPLQKIVEKSVDMNQSVIDNLLNVANCLQSQSDFLAQPPVFSHDHFVIETEDRDLEAATSFADILNMPIHRITDSDQW